MWTLPCRRGGGRDCGWSMGEASDNKSLRKKQPLTGARYADTTHVGREGRAPPERAGRPSRRGGIVGSLDSDAIPRPHHHVLSVAVALVRFLHNVDLWRLLTAIAAPRPNGWRYLWRRDRQPRLRRFAGISARAAGADLVANASAPLRRLAAASCCRRGPARSFAPISSPVQAPPDRAALLRDRRLRDDLWSGARPMTLLVLLACACLSRERSCRRQPAALRG